MRALGKVASTKKKNKFMKNKIEMRLRKLLDFELNTNYSFPPMRQFSFNSFSFRCFFRSSTAMPCFLVVFRRFPFRFSRPSARGQRNTVRLLLEKSLSLHSVISLNESERSYAKVYWPRRPMNGTWWEIMRKKFLEND